MDLTDDEARRLRAITDSILDALRLAASIADRNSDAWSGTPAAVALHSAARAIRLVEDTDQFRSLHGLGIPLSMR